MSVVPSSLATRPVIAAFNFGRSNCHRRDGQKGYRVGTRGHCFSRDEVNRISSFAMPCRTRVGNRMGYKQMGPKSKCIAFKKGSGTGGMIKRVFNQRKVTYPKNPPRGVSKKRKGNPAPPYRTAANYANPSNYAQPLPAIPLPPPPLPNRSQFKPLPALPSNKKSKEISMFANYIVRYKFGGLNTGGAGAVKKFMETNRISIPEYLETTNGQRAMYHYDLPILYWPPRGKAIPKDDVSDAALGQMGYTLTA